MRSHVRAFVRVFSRLFCIENDTSVAHYKYLNIRNVDYRSHTIVYAF